MPKAVHVKHEGNAGGLSAMDLCIVSVVYLSAMLVVDGFPHFAAGFPLDDSWIHQVVARNLAQDGTLGFLPGVRSSGSSSLLWSFLLAAKWRFMPGLSPIFFSGLLCGAFLAATGCGLMAMARKDGLSPFSCWIWALTPALDGNFVWLGVIGMEHVLFAALSIFGIYFWFSKSRGSVVASAVCLGALSLTRPEGLVLAILLMLAARWAGRHRKDLAVLSLIVGLCVLIFLAANYITSHSWLPTTYAGRKWLYFGTENIRLKDRVIFPYALARTLLSPWAIKQTHLLYIFNAMIILLFSTGVWSLWKQRGPRTLCLCFWSLVHILIYSAILPSRSHGGRYQPLFLALTFPLLFLGLKSVFERLLAPNFSDRTFSTGVIVTAALCGFFSIRAWRAVTLDGVRLIETTHAVMGQDLINTLPSGTKVAAFDIGRMGYLYGGNLIDLGGLTDTGFLPYLRQHRMMNYLADRNIRYFVWPTYLDGTSGVSQVFNYEPDAMVGVTKVRTVCADEKIWRVSYDTLTNAAPCQILFRRD